MTAFVIKNFPEDLHSRLKARAQRNHRSLTREVLSLVESALNEPRTEQPAVSRGSAWQAYQAKLQRMPDGSLFNPDGIEDEAFFESLARSRENIPFTPRSPFA